MSKRVVRLRMMLTLMQRTKNLVLFGVPGVVMVLWIMAVSEQFNIGKLATWSGVFVFVVVLLPVAIFHTVVLVVIERRLQYAEEDAQVPKATARVGEG